MAMIHSIHSKTLKSESKSCIALTFGLRRGREGSNSSLFLRSLHPYPWECMGL